jgi:hypothetical protein
MKLKQHREDVKWLNTWPSYPHCKTIAGRYRNLILFAEEADKLFYRGMYTKKARRVIEDGKVKSLS